MAGRLHACVRPPNLVARLGGDEFAVLIENPSDDPDLVRARITGMMAKPFTIHGDVCFVHASVGVARLAPDEPAAPATLLRRADLAMYVAKRNQKAEPSRAAPAPEERTQPRLGRVGEALSGGRGRAAYPSLLIERQLRAVDRDLSHHVLLPGPPIQPTALRSLPVHDVAAIRSEGERVWNVSARDPPPLGELVPAALSPEPRAVTRSADTPERRERIIVQGLVVDVDDAGS